MGLKVYRMDHGIRTGIRVGRKVPQALRTATATVQGLIPGTEHVWVRPQAMVDLAARHRTVILSALFYARSDHARDIRKLYPLRTDGSWLEAAVGLNAPVIG